jgi:hypothetical protein
MKPQEIAAAAMILTFAVAQSEQDHHPAKHHSPYAGHQESGIAALFQQELDDLRNGAGRAWRSQRSRTTIPDRDTC